MKVPPVVNSMASTPDESPGPGVEMHKAETTELLVEAQAVYCELQEFWLQMSHSDTAT